uniref:Uncharacterized protein n=1 Tax=Anopheles coluzzii TaxID=1518534 RepID=A0A8W7PVG1_ANOCL
MTVTQMDRNGRTDPVPSVPCRAQRYHRAIGHPEKVDSQRESSSSRETIRQGRAGEKQTPKARAPSGANVGKIIQQFIITHHRHLRLPLPRHVPGPGLSHVWRANK